MYFNIHSSKSSVQPQIEVADEEVQEQLEDCAEMSLLAHTESSLSLLSTHQDASDNRNTQSNLTLSLVSSRTPKMQPTDDEVSLPAVASCVTFSRDNETKGSQAATNREHDGDISIAVNTTATFDHYQGLKQSGHNDPFSVEERMKLMELTYLPEVVMFSSSDGNSYKGRLESPDLDSLFVQQSPGGTTKFQWSDLETLLTWSCDKAQISDTTMDAVRNLRLSDVTIPSWTDCASAVQPKDHQHILYPIQMYLVNNPNRIKDDNSCELFQKQNERLALESDSGGKLSNEHVGRTRMRCNEKHVNDKQILVSDTANHTTTQSFKDLAVGLPLESPRNSRNSSPTEPDDLAANTGPILIFKSISRESTKTPRSPTPQSSVFLSTQRGVVEAVGRQKVLTRPQDKSNLDRSVDMLSPFSYSTQHIFQQDTCGGSVSKASNGLSETSVVKPKPRKITDNNLIQFSECAVDFRRKFISPINSTTLWQRTKRFGNKKGVLNECSDSIIVQNHVQHKRLTSVDEHLPLCPPKTTHVRPSFKCMNKDSSRFNSASSIAEFIAMQNPHQELIEPQNESNVSDNKRRSNCVGHRVASLAKSSTAIQKPTTLSYHELSLPKRILANLKLNSCVGNGNDPDSHLSDSIPGDGSNRTLDNTIVNRASKRIQTDLGYVDNLTQTSSKFPSETSELAVNRASSLDRSSHFPTRPIPDHVWIGESLQQNDMLSHRNQSRKSVRQLRVGSQPNLNRELESEERNRISAIRMSRIVKDCVPISTRLSSARKPIVVSCWRKDVKGRHSCPLERSDNLLSASEPNLLSTGTNTNWDVEVTLSDNSGTRAKIPIEQPTDVLIDSPNDATDIKESTNNLMENQTTRFISGAIQAATQTSGSIGPVCPCADNARKLRTILEQPMNLKVSAVVLMEPMESLANFKHHSFEEIKEQYTETNTPVLETSKMQPISHTSIAQLNELRGNLPTDQNSKRPNVDSGDSILTTDFKISPPVPCISNDTAGPLLVDVNPSDVSETTRGDYDSPSTFLQPSYDPVCIMSDGQSHRDQFTQVAPNSLVVNRVSLETIPVPHHYRDSHYPTGQGSQDQRQCDFARGSFVRCTTDPTLTSDNSHIAIMDRCADASGKANRTRDNVEVGQNPKNVPTGKFFKAYAQLSVCVLPEQDKAFSHDSRAPTRSESRLSYTSESNVRLHRQRAKKFDVPEVPVLSKSALLGEAVDAKKPSDNNEQPGLLPMDRKSVKNDKILTREVATSIPVKSTPTINKKVGTDFISQDVVPSLTRQSLPVELQEKVDLQNQTGIYSEKYSRADGKVDAAIHSSKESNFLTINSNPKSTSILSHSTVSFNENTDIHRPGCGLTQYLYKIINPIQSFMAKSTLDPSLGKNTGEPSYSIASIHKDTQEKSSLLEVVDLTQQSPETGDQEVALTLQTNLDTPILQTGSSSESKRLNLSSEQENPADLTDRTISEPVVDETEEDRLKPSWLVVQEIRVDLQPIFDTCTPFIVKPYELCNVKEEAKLKASECLCLKQRVMKSEVLKTPISHQPLFQKPQTTNEHSQTSSHLARLNQPAGVVSNRLDSSHKYKQSYYGVFVNSISEPILTQFIDLIPIATECKLDHPIIVEPTSIPPVEVKTTIVAYSQGFPEYVCRNVSGCSTSFSDIDSSSAMQEIKHCMLIEPTKTGVCVTHCPTMSTCSQTDITLKTPSGEEEDLKELAIIPVSMANLAWVHQTELKILSEKEDEKGFIVANDVPVYVVVPMILRTNPSPTAMVDGLPLSQEQTAKLDVMESLRTDSAHGCEPPFVFLEPHISASAKHDTTETSAPTMGTLPVPSNWRPNSQASSISKRFGKTGCIHETMYVPSISPDTLRTADPFFPPKHYDDRAHWSQPINEQDNTQATSIKMDKVEEPKTTRCCSHMPSTCKCPTNKNLPNSTELLRTTLILELEDPNGTFKSIRLPTPEENLRSVTPSPTSLHSTDMKFGKLNVRTSIEYEAVPIDYRSSQHAPTNESHCCRCGSYPLQKHDLRFEPIWVATHEQHEPDNFYDKTTQVQPDLDQLDSISSIQPLLLNIIPLQLNAVLFTRPTMSMTAAVVLVSKQEADDARCVRMDPSMMASLTEPTDKAAQLALSESAQHYSRSLTGSDPDTTASSYSINVDLSTADKLTPVSTSNVISENLPVSLATVTPLDQVDCVKVGHESETSQNVCYNKHSPPLHRVTGSSESVISTTNEPINCRNLTDFSNNDHASEGWHCKTLWSKRHMPHLLSKDGSLGGGPDYSNINSLYENNDVCSTGESHQSSGRTNRRWKQIPWMSVLDHDPIKYAPSLSTIRSPAVSELLQSPSPLLSNREQSVTDPKSHALTTTEETSVSERTTTTSSTCSTTLSAALNDPSQMTVNIPIVNFARSVLNHCDESGVRNSEVVFFGDNLGRQQAPKNYDNQVVSNLSELVAIPKSSQPCTLAGNRPWESLKSGASSTPMDLQYNIDSDLSGRSTTLPVLPSPVGTIDYLQHFRNIQPVTNDVRSSGMSKGHSTSPTVHPPCSEETLLNFNAIARKAKTISQSEPTSQLGLSPRLFDASSRNSNISGGRKLMDQDGCAMYDYTSDRYRNKNMLFYPHNSPKSITFKGSHQSSCENVWTSTEESNSLPVAGQEVNIKGQPTNSAACSCNLYMHATRHPPVYPFGCPTARSSDDRRLYPPEKSVRPVCQHQCKRNELKTGGMCDTCDCLRLNYKSPPNPNGMRQTRQFSKIQKLFGLLPRTNNSHRVPPKTHNEGGVVEAHQRGCGFQQRQLRMKEDDKNPTVY
ncbi:hypothetical protein PHET_06826 [Paragonimus heterotremus]|uniref:Uncharacterized protein n=1 Tax=Paragonimus heterotremus TaxID=100268 RepID=A0A8J4WQI7_9TREM|nr:hypothetical protein PHET_06826 [Paragonimus heterotremus]